MTAPAALTVAMLGAKGSAAPAVAEALRAAAGRGRDGTRGLRVIVDAAPGDRPDVAVLVVDAVCPIRPDDVEVARGVAARIPLAVTLAGGAGTTDRRALAETVDVTSRRLADAGVRAPVHVMDDDDEVTVAAAALLDSVTALAAGTPLPAPRDGTAATPDPGRAADPGTAVVDWLLARRTEAITARSQSLRQDVQALRMEVVQLLHRSVRDLGGRAREDLAAAPRARIDGLVHGLAADADAAVADTVSRADRRIDSLVARHLGASAPAAPRIPAPTSGIEPSHPPRTAGEEALMLLMGAAGGTGVGRMLLSPLAEVPGLAALVIPLALLCGLALGAVTVRVRRTQALRTHTVAAVNEKLASLRAETEQSLGARILAAESIITDGFAHDPGPRVADLERRIRRIRQGRPTPQAGRPSTFVPPAGAGPVSVPNPVPVPHPVPVPGPVSDPGPAPVPSPALAGSHPR